MGLDEGCKLEEMRVFTIFASSEATNVVESRLVGGPSAVKQVEEKCGPATETVHQLTYF